MIRLAQAAIVEVADVGEGAPSSTTSVGPTRPWRSRSRGSPTGPHEPTPIGVFRAVDRPTYGDAMQRQWSPRSEKKGPRRPRRVASRSAAHVVGRLSRRRRVDAVTLEGAEDHAGARLGPEERVVFSRHP